MSSLTAPRHGFGAFILLTLVIIFLVSATHTQLSHQLDSRDIPTANNESSLTKDDGLYVRGIPTANNESSLTKNDGLYVRDVSAAPDESSLINNDGIVTAQPVQQSSIRFGSAHFQISNLFRSIRIKRDTTTLYSARYVGQQGVDRMNAIGLTKHGSTDLDDLENDGWTVSNGASSHFPPGLEAPLRHLIPGLAGGGSTQTLRNDKAYTDVNGKKRGPTGGFYVQVLNPDASYLIALNNQSPLYVVQQDPKFGALRSINNVQQLRALLPPINRWSDIAWIQWSEACQESGHLPGDLKYIVRDKIITPETKRVMEQVIDQHISADALRLPYPGKGFAVNTDAGLALLGTSQGNGITWFLHDHRDQIKTKVSKITIFTAGTDYFMIFELQ